LIKGIQSTLNAKMDPQQKRAVKHILDNANTNVVSAPKFSEFLRGFGPFRNCLANVARILAEKYNFNQYI